MKWPAHCETRESHTAWLGAIPKHWGLSPIKHQVRFLSGGTPSKDRADFWDGDIPWVSSKDMKAEVLEDSEDHISDAALKARSADLIPPNTVLTVVRGMILAHTLPVAITARPVTFNQDLKALVPKRSFTSEYTAWLLRGLSKEILGRVDEAAHGTKALRMNDWLKMLVPVPPRAEQDAIAAFLRTETAKLDTLIAKQERLIDLLQENRQAVISHAITKGLNPKASLKNSAAEWLGKVPSHWKIMPLMHLTAPRRPIMYGIVLPGPNVATGIPIVKGGDVRPHRLKLDLLNRTTPEIEAPYARARLLPNDVVYAIRGGIGDAELVPEELEGANITQDVARVSPALDIQPKWLLYALKSSPIFGQLEQGAVGATIRGINIFSLKRARIPVPPSIERLQIAEYLDQMTRELDLMVNKSRHSIDLMREHRSALISAAVTGKIDVRCAA